MKERKGTRRLGLRVLPRLRAAVHRHMVYLLSLVGFVIIVLLFLLCGEMGEWVRSVLIEVRLLWLVEKGLLPLKEVAKWRVTTGDVFLFP
jgi:hypothetical protein